MAKLIAVSVIAIAIFLFVGMGCANNNAASTNSNTTISASNSAEGIESGSVPQVEQETFTLPSISEDEKTQAMDIAEKAVGEGSKATSVVAGPYTDGTQVYQVSVQFEKRLYEVVINKETLVVMDQIFRGDL